MSFIEMYIHIIDYIQEKHLLEVLYALFDTFCTLVCVMVHFNCYIDACVCYIVVHVSGLISVLE